MLIIELNIIPNVIDVNFICIDNFITTKPFIEFISTHVFMDLKLPEFLLLHYQPFKSTRTNLSYDGYN